MHGVSLQLQPKTFAEAAQFVRCHHRHHHPPVSWRFGCAVNDGGEVVGVIIVGRPVARHLDDGYTAEVTRCCVLEEAPRNVCSMLYAAAWRAARALGYHRLITYTRADEPGTSLRAAGWRVLHETAARSWCRSSPGRPRVDKSEPFQRKLWQAGSSAGTATEAKA